MGGRVQNLKPFRKGVSGNPGGRPKKRPVTDDIDRLLAEEAPKGNGQTWAAVIALAVVRRAAKGDVRAFREIADRMEGKPRQAVEIGSDADLTQQSLTIRFVEPGKVLDDELTDTLRHLDEQIGTAALKERISQLEAELGFKPVEQLGS